MSFESNLNKLKIPGVFSAKSNIKAFSGHQVSFVFPFEIVPSTTPKTVILTGLVQKVMFSAGHEVENTKKCKLGKTINLEGFPWNTPKEMIAVHEKGILAAAQASKMKVRVLGTRNTRPRHLEVVEYDILLDQVQGPPDDRYEIEDKNAVSEAVKTVNEVVGRSVAIKITEEGILLRIPSNWLLHNLSSLEKRAVAGNPGPVIEDPVAFPIIGSRLIFTEETSDDPRAFPRAIIRDFWICPESLVWILCEDVKDPSNTWKLTFSRVYAMKESELQNPRIFTNITPLKYASIPHTYLNDTRRIISHHLGAWKLWKVDPEKHPLRALCSTIGEKPKNIWLEPEQIVHDPEITALSFVSGVASQEDEDGSRINTTSVYSRRRTAEDNEGFFVGEVPDDYTMDSMIVNAAIGRAIPVGSGKTETVFFTTSNAKTFSLYSTQPFKATTPTGVATIDMINPGRMVGIEGRSDRDKTQKTVEWCSISEGFYHFYIWATTIKKAKGSDGVVCNHPLFKDKTTEEIEAMFEDEEMPEIVEMYRLMAFGYNESMSDLSTHPWTHWFISEVLFANPEDLLIKKKEIEEAEEDSEEEYPEIPEISKEDFVTGKLLEGITYRLALSDGN